LLGNSTGFKADGGQGGGNGSFPWSLGSQDYGTYTTNNNQSLDHTHNVSGTTGTGSGSGTAATTISPYLGIYYIIKT
jgi:hypothetical protein